MSEYIDKTEMLIRLKCLEPKKDDFRDDDCFQAAESQHDMICEYLKPMQPADVAPVVHGKWAFQYSTTDPEPFYSFCSHCRKPIKSTRAYHIYKFCPHCGAKMDESEGTCNE